jgi:hypothetical protein
MDSPDHRARSLPETEAAIEALVYALLATFGTSVAAPPGFKEFASNGCELTRDMTGLVP